MRIFLITLVLCLAGCDTVNNDYETITAARADDLFDRGWLPEILPESSINIRTSNDLDVNISTGGFDYASADSGNFYKSLTPGAPENSKFANWQNTIKEYSSDGFSAWTFKQDSTTWVFFCHTVKSRCDYFMW